MNRPSPLAKKLWHILLDHPEGLTIADISRASGVERERIEWMVKTMREQQFVVSTRLPDNSRQLLHRPTQLLVDHVSRPWLDHAYAPNVPLVARALACRIPLEVHWSVAA